jgi:hypothetical protein
METSKKTDITGAPEIVEDIHDEDVKKGHMDYSLVDKEVAKYASETIVEVDEETNTRLRRMIDKRVLAVMVFTYFIQTLDKGTMSFASIMGIIKDTHLHGTQVSETRPHEMYSTLNSGNSTLGSQLSSISLFWSLNTRRTSSFSEFPLPNGSA